MRQPSQTERPDLQRPLMALMVATDYAHDRPRQSGLKVCLLADRLARQMGAGIELRSQVHYTALLRFIGCPAASPDLAEGYDGQDNLLRNIAAEQDKITLDQLWQLAKKLGGPTLVGRARAARFIVFNAQKTMRTYTASSCEVALSLAGRLGLPAEVLDAVGSMHERWDGLGYPGERAGEQIPFLARVVNVARVAEVLHRKYGPADATQMLSVRAGGQLEPALVERFCASADEMFDGLDRASVWEEVVALGTMWPHLGTADFEAMIRVFADLADMKSKYGAGHSQGVADLVAAAAEIEGMRPSEVTTLKHAALLHDLGSMAIQSGIWDKPGRLDPFEREVISQHPRFTETILRMEPRLETLADLAGAHHERIDGRGYPHRVPGANLDLSARLLSTADVYHALIEDRAHRPAFSEDGARGLLEEGAARGRFDPVAVRAVLKAAGHRPAKRLAGPEGLTEREIEILSRVARGASSKEIAARLNISTKTVQNHIRNIYSKIGVTTRASATLYAVEKGLVLRG